MKPKQPTIKGMFVNSHIKALEDERGHEGLLELEKIYGAPLHHFSNFEDVPVREEVKIIEACATLLYPDLSAKELEFEAGRLHFRNFRNTAIGRLIFSTLAANFKSMMLNSQYIAQHVFKNVEFSAKDLGPNQVMVIMKNNDYPLGHFQGLFQEWMNFMQEKGSVTAEQSGNGEYTFTMTWE